MFDKTIVKVAMSGQGVIGRRGFLRGITLGGVGLASVSFTDLMALQAADLRKRNMACIMLWMAGGPSQMDTFDPKPEHANGGGTKSIETSVPGISIAQGWENTAKVMNEIALIRSMTNKEGNHQRATYQLHTGYAPSGTVKHPSFGCVSAVELADPKFDLPHMVSIGGGTVGAGMLGAAYEPFVVGAPDKPPTNVKLPGDDTRRFSRRLALMSELEEVAFKKTGGADRVKDHEALYRQTSDMIKSPHMKTFDISGEDPKLKAAYGDSAFGQGCLLARRLVESGVTFVEVRSNGWDMHDDIHDRMSKNASSVDPAYATLITDLKQRGMLEKTLVVWMGEFGRTPKISPRGGRDHFPRVFNVALAGGGIKGGQVIGSSTPEGTDVKDNPVQIVDLMASFCHSMKIDPKKENMSPLGRPIKIVDGGKIVTPLFA